MKVAAAVALLALAVASPVAAAPPPNDNRADAENLPTFPAATHGTTLEATVERLDPQVSECGRIEGTVWYRIDSAPDGRVVVTVQASSTLAPVVRVYRRGGSQIREVDCGTASAGGTVVTSFETVRGAGYFILVGRRPGASDGEFDLRAELFLPPANDRRADAQPLGRPPATVQATTLGATSDDSDTDECRLGGGSVWYSLTAPSDGRVVVRLTAAGEFDASVLVFERIRSRLELLDCAPTDRSGRALVSAETRRGRTYLILVGQQRGADPGDFTLNVLAAEAAEALPGRAMPRRGVRSTVHGLTDVNDVWSVKLRAGQTYRFAFSSGACASVRLRAPRARSRNDSALFTLRCRAYTAFTPGPDGGGRYTLEVVAASSPSPQPYRLRVGAAGSDDIGIGVGLANGSRTRGALAPSGLDVVDLYHFEVSRLSDVTLSLRHTREFDLLLLTDAGGRISRSDRVTQRRLDVGRYVVAVRGTVGSAGGRYVLSLLLRDVTATSVAASGSSFTEVATGGTVTLSASVAPPPSGGAVELRVDRLDPLTGWHFHRLFRLPGAGGSVSWTPPRPGRWRVRASFLGTSRSSPSRSGYAQIVVR